MSDYELRAGDVPLRAKVESDEFYKSLDPGIAFAVRVLHAQGIETCQSCQGGKGHAYDRPTVDLVAAQDAQGFAAVAALVEYALPVCDLSLVWNVDQLGLPFERLWRITFRSTFEDRADDRPSFLWGYQAQ